MNKTRSHLHMFFKKIKLTHRFFKFSLSICSSWIDRVNFFSFFGSVRFASSLSPPRCHLSFGRRRHGIAPCDASFPLSQDELAVSASSFVNICLPFRAKTEVLNLHHHHKPLSPDHPTLSLYYYKKVISTLVALPTTHELADSLCLLNKLLAYKFT
jgi:hypothetical protein